MPKIIVNAFLTLDGVIQAPGGPDEEPEGGFLHGGRHAPHDDDVVGRRVTEGFADAALKQVESVTIGKGVTYQRLEPSGKPEYGQMGT